MKLNKTVFLLFVLFLLIGCGGGGSHSSSGNGVGITVKGDNVLPLSVNGSCTFLINAPCVSVKVCDPNNPLSCQTIHDILMDTGDVGLRIFKSVLKVSLAPVTDANGDIADCIQYGDNSSSWGPVETASVVLGNESPVQVPIQVIDSKFATPPNPCSNSNSIPRTDPSEFGFNGSLGLGFYLEDCGQDCADGTNTVQYYSCNGPACSPAMVPTNKQVENPVPFLPNDNNGVMIELPAVPSGGALYADGAVVLGIGTQSNNTPNIPSGVQVYDVDSFGDFITDFDGNPNPSFIDSGSNGLFFPPPSGGQLPPCQAPYSVWYCPSSTKKFSATTQGATNLSNSLVKFQMGNFLMLANSPNWVFANIGGDLPVFDWGLPFFLGRKVFIGFEGQFSSDFNATGPYWAF